MNVTIQIPPGKEDTTALMSHTARRPLLLIRMIAGCYIGLAVLFSVALLPEPPGILGLALVILFFVLMSIFRRRFEAKLPSNFSEPGVLTITDEHLTIVRGPVTTTVRWEAVNSVKPVMHLWAVRYCDQSMIAIPQSAFSPVEDARWREFLRTRGLGGMPVPRPEQPAPEERPAAGPASMTGPASVAEAEEARSAEEPAVEELAVERLAVEELAVEELARATRVGEPAEPRVEQTPVVPWVEETPEPSRRPGAGAAQVPSPALRPPAPRADSVPYTLRSERAAPPVWPSTPEPIQGE